MDSNPSYLWRSFLAARLALVEGLMWNIGNGKSVKIWFDKWLPKPRSFRVQSVRRGMEENALVSCLIDHQTCSWKSNLICDTFEPEEAELICRIPLSMHSALTCLLGDVLRMENLLLRVLTLLLLRLKAGHRGRLHQRLQQRNYGLRSRNWGSPMLQR